MSTLEPRPYDLGLTAEAVENGAEPDASRWSPEVLAYNDFPAIAQREAEREARREAEGDASRAAWAALTPAEQEAELAREDPEYEAHSAELAAEAEAAGPELELD